MKLTSGSLFDGFGGLRRGFEDAGFQTKWTVDLLNGQDITKLDPADFERVDLISGGPPCQRGSVAARFTRSRTKVTLWPEMLRFVQALRPAWVVLENVPGFQREMVDWTADLYQLGYGCAGQLIDSRHWVPQQRTRCFVIARLGVSGMALWNHLYADGERMEIGKRAQAIRQRESGDVFSGNCPDCMPSGIFARVSQRKLALMGAGNAVTQPVARFLAERIKAVIEAEKEAAH